jgi:type II secretory pathway pseudopilin PulG
MRKEGMTLLEVLAIVIIIGILAAIALPNFAPIREKALDKEATASLKLIQAAEKIYKLETDFYYPYSGTETVQGTINTNLKLSLPTDNTTRKWTYTVKSTGCADATRYSGPDSRQWNLTITNTGEPSSGACP